MTKIKTYSEKLKDPRWQKKRLEIFNLRGFKCEKCGCEENELHIHHRFYISGREAWEYDNDVFQVLCSDCHKKEHDTKTKNNNSKYEEIIKKLEQIEAIDNRNIEAVYFILYMYIESKDFEFLVNLSNSLNSTSFFSVISYLVNDYTEREIASIQVCKRISHIEDFLSKNSILIDNQKDGRMD